jgi:hypothetical protein
MSAGIQLSSEIITGIKSLLVEHDASADNDLVFMQYLTAITGYVLAHQNDPALDKRGLMNDLVTFLGQVVDQVESDLRPAPAAADAFGVWKPGQP